MRKFKFKIHMKYKLVNVDLSDFGVKYYHCIEGMNSLFEYFTTIKYDTIWKFIYGIIYGTF